MIPPLRVVPPSYAQLAGDPSARYALFIATELERAAQIAGAIGLAATVEAGVVRVGATLPEVHALAGALRERSHPAADALERYLSPVTAWQIRSRAVRLDRPVIMGIVNLTADSFSGDGVGTDVRRAVDRAEVLRNAGATLIDLGAETARADRPSLDAAEEAVLVAAAVRALVRERHTVSIDTYKGIVALAAIDEGAEVVNDISGLTAGSAAADVAARAATGYVLNYSYSPPKRRPDVPPVYADVAAETLAWFEDRLRMLHAVGLRREQVAIDPGIAFGKSHDEDIQVLRRLGEFRTPGLPLLLAHSRKNFIGSVGGTASTDRDLETHVVTAMAYAQGVRIFRVHDVEGTRRAIAIASALAEGARGQFAPDSRSWPWRAGVQIPTGGAASDKAAPSTQRW